MAVDLTGGRGWNQKILYTKFSVNSNTKNQNEGIDSIYIITLHNTAIKN